jgi:hypothetical protein
MINKVAFFFNLLLVTIFVMLSFTACNHSNIEKSATQRVKQVKDTVTVNSIQVDSSIEIEKQDTIFKKKAVKAKVKSKEVFIRFGEQCSDEKFNGAPIVLQENLSKAIFKNNPDTIKNYLKRFYQGQERLFPRSIADNFEKGTSKEYISYPKLNFRVELFENEYSKNPYKVLGYSAWKVNEEIIVE